MELNIYTSSPLKYTTTNYSVLKESAVKCLIITHDCSGDEGDLPHRTLLCADLSCGLFQGQLPFCYSRKDQRQGTKHFFFCQSHEFPSVVVVLFDILNDSAAIAAILLRYFYAQNQPIRIGIQWVAFRI